MIAVRWRLMRVITISILTLFLLSVLLAITFVGGVAQAETGQNQNQGEVVVADLELKPTT